MQMMTNEKMDELAEPSLMVVFTKRPGELTTLRMRLPGDIGGVDAALISSYTVDRNWCVRLCLLNR